MSEISKHKGKKPNTAKKTGGKGKQPHHTPSKPQRPAFLSIAKGALDFKRTGKIDHMLKGPQVLKQVNLN